MTVDRLQFAFTVTFHYLFPVLTMGLALFIFWLKTVSLRRGPAGIVHEHAAGFWAQIFGVTFAVGVVTGIPRSSSSAPTGPASPTTPAA